MNNDKWLKYLEYCTSEFGHIAVTDIDNDTHIGLTFKFFKECFLDSSESKFLDVGCGTAQTNRIKGKWTGLDLCNSGNGIIQGDAHELPFKNESFSVVFSSHTIEHTISPLICLTEMYRVLTKTGHLILGVPVAPGFISTAHNYVLTMDGWALLLKRSGFIVRRSRVEKDCGMFHCTKREEKDGKKD